MSAVLAQFSSAASHAAFGLIAFVMTIAMMSYLSWQGWQLRTDAAPSRVVSLELAWKKSTAESIVNSWEEANKKDIAIRQVLVDFIFIAAYACFLFYLGLAAERVALAHGLSSLAHVARLAAWGGLIAGALDCLENVGLLALLLWRITGVVVVATSIFASLKFLLIANALLISANAFAVTGLALLRPPPG